MSFEDTFPTRRIVVSNADAVETSVLAGYAKRVGLQAYIAHEAQEVLSAVAVYAPDAVVVDMVYRRGHPDGLWLLRELRDRWPTLPVAVLSKELAIANTVRAMQFGAVDVLAMPQDPKAVLQSFWRAPDPKTPVRDSLMTRQEMLREHLWRVRVDLGTYIDRDVSRALGLNQAEMRRILAPGMSDGH